MLSPVVVPRPVHQGLEKVREKGVNIIDILQVMKESIAIGHVENGSVDRQQHQAVHRGTY